MSPKPHAVITTSSSPKTNSDNISEVTTGQSRLQPSQLIAAIKPDLTLLSVQIEAIYANQEVLDAQIARIKHALQDYDVRVLDRPVDQTDMAGMLASLTQRITDLQKLLDKVLARLPRIEKLLSSRPQK